MKSRANARCQVKICGLTRPEQALACADLGADAIGLVFYPPSPRNVTIDQAAAICSALPKTVTKVGVFVDPEFDQLCRIIEQTGLNAVQLHGNEPPQQVAQLRDLKVRVIKALFASRAPFLREAERYQPDAYLCECGAGKLPGGNARTWKWHQALPLKDWGPLILAGGLDAENVSQALQACAADAVDLSSGVEKAPGIKDLIKVKQLIDAVAAHRPPTPIRRIFNEVNHAARDAR